MGQVMSASTCPCFGANVSGDLQTCCNAIQAHPHLLVCLNMYDWHVCGLYYSNTIILIHIYIYTKYVIIYIYIDFTKYKYTYIDIYISISCDTVCMQSTHIDSMHQHRWLNALAKSVPKPPQLGHCCCLL